MLTTRKPSASVAGASAGGAASAATCPAGNGFASLPPFLPGSPGALLPSQGRSGRVRGGVRERARIWVKERSPPSRTEAPLAKAGSLTFNPRFKISRRELASLGKRAGENRFLHWFCVEMRSRVLALRRKRQGSGPARLDDYCKTPPFAARLDFPFTLLNAGAGLTRERLPPLWKHLMCPVPPLRCLPILRWQPEEQEGKGQLRAPRRFQLVSFASLRREQGRRRKDFPDGCWDRTAVPDRFAAAEVQQRSPHGETCGSREGGLENHMACEENSALLLGSKSYAGPLSPLPSPAFAIPPQLLLLSRALIAINVLVGSVNELGKAKPAGYGEDLLIIPGMSQQVLVLFPVWFQQVFGLRRRKGNF
ncbi:hypothetical protein L345_08415, partial [Ophiophagus hannah]